MSPACVAGSRLIFLGRQPTDVMMGVARPTFTTYVYAMLLTSIASALLLLTLFPRCCFAAILGANRIGERPSLTWPAMAATLGVSLMIEQRHFMGAAGNRIAALVSSLSFAVMLVLAEGAAVRMFLAAPSRQ